MAVMREVLRNGGSGKVEDGEPWWPRTRHRVKLGRSEANDEREGCLVGSMGLLDA